MIEDWLVWAYPATKAFHITAVISWMAGLFYLPRLFVYHAEEATPGDQLSETLKVMERKLMRVIMNPAMIATWLFGLLMVFTPGLIDWTEIWPWIKTILVLAMTWFHHCLVKWMKSFAADQNERSGRFYRLANEIPTLAMIGIVLMVVMKPF
jgi:putative membrane protein